MAKAADQPGEKEKSIIVVDDLTSGYGQKIILKDVNLTVSPGEILVVLERAVAANPPS